MSPFVIYSVISSSISGRSSIEYLLMQVSCIKNQRPEVRYSGTVTGLRIRFRYLAAGRKPLAAGSVQASRLGRGQHICTAEAPWRFKQFLIEVESIKNLTSPFWPTH